LILDDLAPSLNAVSRNKKLAGVRQGDGPASFYPDKKSAVLQQKIS